MAPAAKESSHGITLIREPIRNTPKMPDIGSTTPDKVPYKNAFLLENPSSFNGREMAAPSGMFCRPIPIPKASALAMVVAIVSLAIPKVNPTAIPSGILCSVTAINNMVLLFKDELIPSGEELPGWRWGRSVSNSHKKQPPNRNPPAAGIHAVLPFSSAISIAGINSDQIEAAIMIPAANPINTFCKSG